MSSLVDLCSGDGTLQQIEPQQNDQVKYFTFYGNWIFNIFLFQSYYNYNQDTAAASTNTQYYPDYTYNQYQQEQPVFNPLALPQDRQGGLEALLAAPLVVTAFVAALFGGTVFKISNF